MDGTASSRLQKLFMLSLSKALLWLWDLIYSFLSLLATFGNKWTLSHFCRIKQKIKFSNFNDSDSQHSACYSKLKLITAEIQSRIRKEKKYVHGENSIGTHKHKLFGIFYLWHGIRVLIPLALSCDNICEMNPTKKMHQRFISFGVAIINDT